ncbi:MAG: hypothetical protein ACXWDI_00595 [Nocardioides sp.]
MRRVANPVVKSPVVELAVDVVVGTVAYSLDVAASVAERAAPVLGPVARTALRPAVLPTRLQPAHWLEAAARRGFLQRRAAAHEVGLLLDELVPVVLDEVVRRTDLTALVMKHVDLDDVVEGVDLDAAVSRVDLDAVASRLDVDAVAQRLDIEAVLNRLDLTQVVLQRVDLDLLVREVLDHLDLASLAAEVIDAVDLPEIIRDSTGSMASETVMGARMQGIAADETVARVRDRLLLRRGRGSGAQIIAQPSGPVDDRPG